MADADYAYFLADSILMIFQYGNHANFCPSMITDYQNGRNVTHNLMVYLKYTYGYDISMYDRDNIKRMVEEEMFG